MNDENPNSGVIGLVKLIVSLTVLLVAGLAVALVFDIIPESIFSEGVQKVGLLALIVGLAAAALVLVSKVGK